MIRHRATFYRRILAARNHPAVDGCTVIVGFYINRAGEMAVRNAIRRWTPDLEADVRSIDPDSKTSLYTTRVGRM